MTNKNKTTEQAEALSDVARTADTFDNAERRELLKRIGRVGVAAVPTAMLMSAANKAQAMSGVSDSSPGGGGF